MADEKDLTENGSPAETELSEEDINQVTGGVGSNLLKDVVKFHKDTFAHKADGTNAFIKGEFSTEKFLKNDQTFLK